MTTITALELRKNLDIIIRRVQAGERIEVTYRSKPALTLMPNKPVKSGTAKPEPGSPEAVDLFLKTAAKRRKALEKSGKIALDPTKSTKELYHEMLDNDPKYKPPYHR